MSEEKPKSGPAARPVTPPASPPRLERVPAGYRPPATVRPAPPPGPSAPPPSASVRAGEVPAPPRTPSAASYGLAAREVGADAAIAAGIPHEGRLASDGALRLFALAAGTQASGLLTLGREGRSFGLTFRRGTVEHAASSDPEDELGRFLLRSGAVDADALARAELAAAGRGDLVTSLVSERLVGPGEIAALLQAHGAEIVQRALAVEEGAWSWSPQAAPPQGAFPLGSPFAMLCAAVRTLDAAALVRRLGAREHRVASRVAGRIRLEDLRLTPQEARAAGLFDGSRSPVELAAANPAEALAILRMAVLLGEVELLAFGAPRDAAPVPAAPPAPAAARAAGPAVPTPPADTRPPPGSSPAPVPRTTPAPKPVPAASPGSPQRQAVPQKPAAPAAPKPAAPARTDAASLEALYAKLKGSDHFAVLGVRQDAAAAQIKAAYFQLAKSYHPDALPAGADPHVAKLCADVFAKVSEAWSVLGDEASRAAYLEQLRSGGPAEVDVMAILEAENVFQAGTLLVKARKYDEALRKFDEAMRLNPDEAEFCMWKAWCEFVLADDKKRQLGPACATVEDGLRKNPRCAQGYLFLGQMAKLAGDLALAEKQLRRGLQIAPEHADMQRELKYLRK